MAHLEQNREFIKGAIAGLCASIVMFVLVELFHWVGITKYGVSYLAGDTVFTYKNNLEMNLIAFFIHSGVGIFWGVIFAFLFTKVFSSDHYYIKIIFMAFCIFFFHLGFLDEPFHYKREIHERTLDLLIIMGGYLIYGFVMAIIFKKLKIIKSEWT